MYPFLSVNSISVNLALIMFSIYYFSEVEEFNRVIEIQLRKEGRASRWKVVLLRTSQCVL